jgi:hypothetical protein
VALADGAGVGVAVCAKAVDTSRAEARAANIVFMG